MASRSEDGKLIERNSDAMTFQATFEESGRKTRMQFFSDIDWEVSKYIVKVTEYHARWDKSRLERLMWDIFHLAHHSSYLSLSDEKGTTITTPDPDIKDYLKTMGNVELF